MATQNEKAVIDLVINGQQAQAALTEVGKAATVARRELSKMREADDPAAFAKKMREYQQLAAAETDMRTRMKGAASGWAAFKQNVAGTLTGVLGGNLLQAGLQQIIGLAPVVLEHSLKMADSFADIGKNANMSTKEVEALNQKLYDMPTRTSTEDLRAMAATGGQFGVGADEMDRFVDGANRVNVAIGESFGGAEQTAEQMLKLRNIFTDIRTQEIDQDMLHIANALNVLEAQGAATAPVMADFANRMGGVLIPLGASSGQILGISAELQELGVTAERGGTAVVNIFQKMLTETDTYAKVAGKSSEVFKGMIKDNIVGAFMAYVEGLKKVSGSQVDFMAVLEKSKLTGAGEMEVLSKLTANTKDLRDKMQTGIDTTREMNSVNEEYNKKNIALAVGLKKLADLKEQLLTRLTPLAEGFVSLTVKLLGLNSASQEATTAFKNQRDAYTSLEKQTPPLLKRHDELKAKTKLTKDEQVELNKIIATIAQTIPSAVTQFDAMGNAMAISTEKARAYIVQQKEVLKYTNKIAIEENKNELAKLRAEQLRLLETRKRGVVQTSTEQGQYDERDMTADELTAASQAITAKNKEIAEKEALISGLSGDYLGEKESTRRRNERRAAEAAASGGQPGIAPPKDGPGVDLGESPEEKAARLKREREIKAAEKHEDDYAKLLEDARQRTAQARDNEFEKDQIAFGTHYAKLLELAGSDKTKQAQVEEQMYIELAAIQEKADKKAAETTKKAHDEALKEKQEYDKMMADMAIDQLEKIRDADLATNDLAHAGGKISDNVHQATELNILQQFLQAKLTLQEVYAQDVASTEADITQNLSEQNNLRAAINKQDAQDRADLQSKLITRQWAALEKLASDERLSERQRIEAKEALKESQVQYVNEGIAGLKLMVGEHTVAYKAMFAAERAYAIAKIAMNTYKEISDVWANPQFTLLGFGGPVVKGLFTALAVARGAAAVASVSGLAMKDDGGFTNMDSLYGGASGFKTKPTMVNKGAGSYMVGEKRPEWIMGGAMLENPVMANLAHALEAVQVTGAYRNLSTLPAGASGGSQATSGNVPGQDLTPLLYEMQLMRGELGKIKNLKVVNNYRAFEEYQDDVMRVRIQNTL